jgi:hypothetical protein
MLLVTGKLVIGLSGSVRKKVYNLFTVSLQLQPDICGYQLKSEIIGGCGGGKNDRIIAGQNHEK